MKVHQDISLEVNDVTKNKLISKGASEAKDYWACLLIEMITFVNEVVACRPPLLSSARRGILITRKGWIADTLFRIRGHVGIIR